MMAHEFGLLRRILKERSGLNLGDDKQGMLEGKLRPLLKEFALPSMSHLALALMKPDAHHLRDRAAQAVTVQESYFFRDKVPFHYFIDVMLPKLMVKREVSRRIRVWCAAAATGQEAYSLAMELAERERQLVGWTIEIVATDFAEDALRKARKGLYSQFEVQRGLPVSLLVKYFSKAGNAWEISPDIRGKVAFGGHNLLDDGQALGVFDVIFCRNVLIYFDDVTKRTVFARLAPRLASDGFLVLGAAETTTHLSNDFMAVPERLHGVFCFTPAAAAAASMREEARRLKGGEGASDSDAAPGAARLCASPR
ncbi:MAG: chemotaxis protein CheR [Methyloceanibacter sp.]|jgi:chemotaxis protein methyltransferase CheR|nr:chemotaxis protein CheR [Methyloceanibacter sp.]